MDKNLIGDLHCHPTMRPFNRSLPGGINDSNPQSKESIWYYDPPTFVDELAQKTLGLSKYSQANYTAMAKGGVRIISNTLYALELGFIDNKLEHVGGQELSMAATSLASGIPVKDLDYIANNKDYDYYDNLRKSYDYLLQMSHKTVTIDGGEEWTYKVVNDGVDLLEALNEPNTLAVIVNVEGGHNFAERVLSAQNPMDADYEKTMLENLKEVKRWEFRPFYITVVHHFFNGICGNTRSFPPGIASNNLDQSYMLGTGMTTLGEEFIHEMLDNKNGTRILVDCKHLSIRGRIRYYEMLETTYADENIPVLYTHSAVNGRKSIHEVYKKGMEEGWGPSEYCTNIPTAPEIEDKFNDWCINIFDDEIIIIAKSGGLMGMEFDRRIAGYEKEDDLKAKASDVDDWTELIWNNVEHIAETLDNAGLDAWDSMCIGSDFDGIINSIYGIWTEEEMPKYKGFLFEQVKEFLKRDTLEDKNRLDPQEIVDKIMYKNLLDFYKKNLKKAHSLTA